MSDRLILEPGSAAPPPKPVTEPPAERPRLTLMQRAVIWIVGLIVLVVTLYMLKGILLPFLVGAGVAYFLDPAVRRLTQRGVPRAVAATGMIVLLFGGLITTLVFVTPMMISEAQALSRELPGWLEAAKEWINTHLPGDIEDEETALGQMVADGMAALRENAQMLALGAFYGVSSLVSIVLFWVVMPVVAFYLLIDWPRVMDNFDEHLPRDHAMTIRQLATDIDASIAGFVRGTLIVVSILTVYYAATLSLVGLNYGLVVGVVAGLISFIPYVGAFIAGALAIGLALVQFWGDLWWIGVVVAVFLLGQFLESNVLVPKLVGSSVNLHPVWLIFAVMAFGSLFGLTGAIIAVPVAAALGVLARFALQRYRDSTLYRGRIEIEKP